MARLSASDAMFLYAERPEMPMHVGGLHLYRRPEGAPRDFLQSLYADLVATTNLRPPYNRKLKWPRTGIGLPHWVEDPEPDLSYHFRHSALARPGRFRELFTLVSRLHGIALDRSRPLWEMHLIEGLQSGQFAVYVKNHHAMVDGVAAMRLLQQPLSEDPDARGMPHPWELAAEASAPRSDAARRRNVVRVAAEQIQTQVGALPGAARTLARLAASLNIPADSRAALPLQAPRSILNTRISGARRIVAQSYSLARIKTIAKAYDATINDVVLAMSAGALRRYLRNLDALPDKPLTAMVPVAVRPADGDEFGNAVSLMLVNLATHIPDPARRMAIIQASVRHAKSLLANLSYSEVLIYTSLMAGPPMITALPPLAGRVTPPFNIVISNVPGPRKPLYWNGARLEGVYPISIPAHSQAANITVTSYVDSLDVGITACRKSAPQIQRLIDHIETSLGELESAAGLASGRAGSRRKAG